jgi:hypothetical protein
MGGGFGGNYGMDMGTGGGFMGGEMETKSSEKKVIYFCPACVIGVTNGACRPVCRKWETVSRSSPSPLSS